MAWIRQVADHEAEGALAAAFRAALARAGRVFGIVRLMSIEPQVLDASMAFYRTLMHGPGPLTRARAELIAVVVSRANHCHY